MGIRLQLNNEGQKMSALILKSQKTPVNRQIPAMKLILENQNKKAQAMSQMMLNQTKNNVSISSMCRYWY